MKNLKKIAALLLAMALVLSLFAACGNDSGSSGSSTPESSTASGESSEEAPESSEASTGGDDGEIHPMRIVQPGNLPDRKSVV